MAQAPNIRLDTRTLAPDDRHALTACADIVLSLHRGEGFGLVLAEAMALGKPVIATGWSGNTDFINNTNAALVGYRLVPARDDRLVYRGLWAEPDIAEAARLLRRFADDPALRQDVGSRARETISNRLGGQSLIAALDRQSSALAGAIRPPAKMAAGHPLTTAKAERPLDGPANGQPLVMAADTATLEPPVDRPAPARALHGPTAAVRLGELA